MNEAEDLTEFEAEELEALTAKDEAELSDAEVTSKIKLSVKRRFDYPTWLLVFEFQNRHNRRADCLALNTSPSRNFKLVGFEFKASRSDWLAELRDHEKADYFVELCDEWYVVAGRRGIVDETELPDGWGLFELKPSGRLYKLVESDLSDLQERAPDRRFFAKFLKKAIGTDSNFTYEDIREAERRGYEKAKEKAIDDHLEYDTRRLKQKAESFDKLCESGLTIYPPVSEERIERLLQAEAFIKRIDGDRFDSIKSELEFFENDVERRLESIRESCQELHGALADLRTALENGGEADAC